MEITDPQKERLRQRLGEIYGPVGEVWTERFVDLLDELPPARFATGPWWDERDAVLIAYADHVGEEGELPLRAIGRFLLEHRLDEMFSTVHLLPLFPSSSDDGFSVIDYTRVDPALGDWGDLRALGCHFDLMLDLVLNHVSQESRWFQEYLSGEGPGVRYFHEVDPSADLSAVTRPRSLPLLTEFETSRGRRHVWTTFSADQVDLNYAEPQVLWEMSRVLLDYVVRGARMVRLDAIGYLCKEIGTSCIHLPQTHAVVRFFRELVDLARPGTLLVTETNVPHEENIQYFGNGDEAHLVYQFSLPPLVLDAWLNEDASPLVVWLAGLSPAGRGTAYFNFTASHDGIGVRPLEGLVSESRMGRLVNSVADRGGLVSMRHGPGGRDLPYELNCTFFDAIVDLSRRDSDLQVRRFLSSQALALALRGIPGVYFSSLFGAGNDLDGVRRSGQARRINRRKFSRSELAGVLGWSGSRAGRVLSGYRQLLQIRRQQPAFHPDAAQEVCLEVPPWLVAVLRTSLDGRQRILVLVNVSGRSQRWQLARDMAFSPERELLGGQPWTGSMYVELEPFQTLWLESTE